jgi:hypothetical protein
MSTISASTTTTTAYVVTADTTGALVLQTGASPTTAVTIDTSQNVGIGVAVPTAKLHITQTAASNALLVEDSANPDATPVVIDASGNVIQGTTTSTTGGITGQTYQQHVTAAITGSGALFAGWNATSANGINIARSTSGTIGTFATSGSGTSNSIRFYFDDGTSFVQGAQISAAVDGTAGTSDMPGRLVFSTTADGASSPTERMRIDSSGRALVGTTSASGSNLLQVNSDASINGLTVGEGGGSVSTNTAVGASALAANTTGNNNTAIGGSALSVSTTVGRNTAIGYVAGLATTTGHITAVGAYALYSNTTGDSNVAVGGNNESASAALQTNTTGSNNTAVGVSALQASTTGASNVAIGKDALYANTTASTCVAVGYQALYAQTTPNNNTAVGASAGGSVTTGDANTFIGQNAGQATTPTTTGGGNTYVGASTRGSAATNNREIVLGFNVSGQGTNTVTLGSDQGKIYNSFTVNATWTQTSDVRMKKNIQDDSLGLSFINRLRPVKFTWKPSNELEQDNPYYAEENKRDTTTVTHGLIAQEVKAALDAEGVDTFAGWDEGSDGIQAISREMFISPLIKAIQELKAELDTVKAELAALRG